MRCGKRRAGLYWAWLVTPAERPGSAKYCSNVLDMGGVGSRPKRPILALESAEYCGRRAGGLCRRCFFFLS
jgi:hypothetical protein